MQGRRRRRSQIRCLPEVRVFARCSTIGGSPSAQASGAGKPHLPAPAQRIACSFPRYLSVHELRPPLFWWPRPAPAARIRPPRDTLPSGGRDCRSSPMHRPGSARLGRASPRWTVGLIALCWTQQPWKSPGSTTRHSLPTGSAHKRETMHRTANLILSSREVLDWDQVGAGTTGVSAPCGDVGRAD